MAENDNRLTTTTSFSQLLFADDDVEELLNDDDVARTIGVEHILDTHKTPKMLCFGDYFYSGETTAFFSDTTTTTTTTNKSSLTCSDSSSSASSTTNDNIGSMSISNTRKRGGGAEKETVQCKSTVTGIYNSEILGNANRRLILTCNDNKKIKSENPSTTIPMTTTKRREKLGERIAALQQLVSPFGKTDTASVLHEAMGYIRFLQEQVQVLCSPYLQRFPNSLLASSSSPSSAENVEGLDQGIGGIRKDLRSCGLCLVPTECTVHVTNDNGADLWSPAMAGTAVPSPTIMQ